MGKRLFSRGAARPVSTRNAQRDAAPAWDRNRGAGQTEVQKMNNMNELNKTKIGDLASEAGDNAASAVESAAERMKSSVLKGVESAKEAAVDRATQAQHAISETGQRLSDSLMAAAEKSSPDSMTSKTLTMAANGLSEAARRVDNVSLSTLATDARELARRNPMAAAALAAVAGFAVARMMRASSSHRDAA